MYMCMYMYIYVLYHSVAYLNIYMCITYTCTCMYRCTYHFVQVNQLFDNGGTVFFAIVMSFWGKYSISTEHTRQML